MEGIILKALSGFYYVDDGRTVTPCRGRGKLRHAKVTPLVGDRVEFTPLSDGQGALEAVLPRKNQFHRLLTYAMIVSESPVSTGSISPVLSAE